MRQQDTPSQFGVLSSAGRSPFFLILITVSLLCSAQEPPVAREAPPVNTTPTVPTIRETVRQVLVTDKKGHPVSHLPESDFLVFEDEVPQRMVAFRTTYDASLEVAPPSRAHQPGGASPPVSPARVGSESPTRTYLICVDTLHSSFGNVDGARRALTKFFTRNRTPKHSMR
jgi:hypothetical protein